MSDRGLTFRFEDAAFRRRLNEIVGKTKRPEGMMRVAGRELGNQLKKHFRRRDEDSPNHLSERRSHFWLEIGRSVNDPQLESPTMVSVSISDPRFAQKLFGGTIRAKEADALTIPVEERAYDRRADTFERETGLKLFIVKIGGTKANNLENAVLAVSDPASPNHITVEYLLTKSVDQKADTEALPEKAKLESAIIARCQKALDRELQTPGQTGTNP